MEKNERTNKNPNETSKECIQFLNDKISKWKKNERTNKKLTEN